MTFFWQLNYRPLDNDRDLNPTLNGFSPTVTVLQSATSSVPALSTTRKALFVFSILVCIMTIVGFLWILPCDINPCPSIEISSGAKGWETPLYDFGESYINYFIHIPKVFFTNVFFFF